MANMQRCTSPPSGLPKALKWSCNYTATSKRPIYEEKEPKTQPFRAQIESAELPGPPSLWDL